MTRDAELRTAAAAPDLSTPEQQPGAAAAHPAPVAGLTVGHGDAPAEVAAEARATAVLSRLRRFGGAPSPRTSSGHAGVGHAGGTLDAARSRQITARLGQGAPLAPQVRSRMESGFGTSLGHVRVHDGQEAAAHSSALGAKAFTIGNDVFLGSRVDPATDRGEHVLAHEIAHVLDEGGAHAMTARRDDSDDEGDEPAKKTLSAAEIIAGAQGQAGNFGIGDATKAEVAKAGTQWVGPGASDNGKGTHVSADKSRRYREPALKPSLGVTQANFESGGLRPGQKKIYKDLFVANGHVTVTDWPISHRGRRTPT